MFDKYLFWYLVSLLVYLLVLLGLILVGMFWFDSYDTAISTLPGLVQLPAEIDHGAGPL